MDKVEALINLIAECENESIDSIKEELAECGYDYDLLAEEGETFVKNLIQRIKQAGLKKKE